MAADWSHLPKELLQLISEKLNNNEVYLIRSRSVCSTWRSSIPKPHNHFPFNLLPFSDSTNTVRCNLSKHAILLIKPPTTQQQPLHRPWLVRIGPGPNSTANFNKLWHPLLLHQHFSSPFHYRHLDFNQLSVFNLGEVFYIHHILLQNSWRDVYFEKVVVGGHPLSIVTHDHSDEPVMFRCGDDSWTKIPYLEGKADICNFKGWPCLIDKTGLTVIIKPDLSVHLLAEPLLDGGDVKVLVENECELLMVNRYVRNGDDGDVRIDVFRLDEKRRKWVKVENLGDRVLILGEGCSFSASASDCDL
jgi:hypothetical protein